MLFSFLGLIVVRVSVLCPFIKYDYALLKCQVDFLYHVVHHNPQDLQ